MATAAQKSELTGKVSRLVADRFGGDFGRAFAYYDKDQDGRVDRDEQG